MALDGVEGLGEAPLDGLGQLVAKLLELGEARLEVGPLRDELLEPLLLGFVLLVRERIDLAEGFATALEPLDGGDELVAVVALRRFVCARLVEPPACFVGFRVDASRLDLDRRHCFGGRRELLAQLHLGCTESPKLGAELAAARGAGVDVRAERSLEMRDRDLERLEEPFGEPEAPRGEWVLLERIGSFGDRRLEPRPKLLELRRERSAACLQLEQHRLGGLAREPELAALRVVPEAFRRDRRDRRRQQLLLRHDRHSRNELRGVAADEDDKAAEAGVARPLEQGECAGSVVAHDGGGRSSQRRRNRTLAAGLDVEQREGDPLAVLGERTRRRRQPFALGERAVERPQALLEQPNLSVRAARSALTDSSSTRRGRASSSRSRRPAPPPTRAAARAARPRCGAGTAPAAPARAHRRRRRAPPRRRRARRAAIRVSPRPRVVRRRPLVRRVSSSANRSSSPARSSCAMRARRRATSTASFSARSAAVAWSASGRSRLRTSASTSRARSTSIATRASFSSARWRRGLEAPKPGGFLDQAPPLGRLRGEDRLDLALADDGVHPLAEPEVGEQLDEVQAPHGSTVDEVLALAAAVQPTRDRELRVVDGQRPVGVVEEELDLAEVGRPARAAACEEDVVGLLGAQLARAERAGRPADRVGDVGLAGAVRTDDDADARLEPDLDRVRKRLEATQLDRAQVHELAP